MISGVVYLLRIFKMFERLMNNPELKDLKCAIYSMMCRRSVMEAVSTFKLQINDVSLYDCSHRLLRLFLWCNSSQRATASSFTRFLDHTQRRTTEGRTHLDE